MSNTYTDTMIVGEAHIQEFEAFNAATNTGEALGSVTWATSDGAVVSISGQVEDGNTTQVLATAASVGTATLTCTATFGSQIVIGRITVTVSA